MAGGRTAEPGIHVLEEQRPAARVIAGSPASRVGRIDLVCGDGLVDVEGDQGDVANLRASGQIGQRIDGVAEEALPTTGSVFGRQQAGQHIRRQLCVWLDRLEHGSDKPGVRIEIQNDVDLERSLECPLFRFRFSRSRTSWRNLGITSGD